MNISELMSMARRGEQENGSNIPNERQILFSTYYVTVNTVLLTID